MNTYLQQVEHEVSLLAEKQNLHPLQASEKIDQIVELVKRFAIRAREAKDFETLVHLYELLQNSYEIAAERIAPEFAGLARTIAVGGNYWGLKADLARAHVPKRPKPSRLYKVPSLGGQLEGAQQPPSPLFREMMRIRKPTGERLRESSQEEEHGVSLHLEPMRFPQEATIDLGLIPGEHKRPEFPSLPSPYPQQRLIENEVSFPRGIEEISTSSEFPEARDILSTHITRLQQADLNIHSIASPTSSQLTKSKKLGKSPGIPLVSAPSDVFVLGE